MPQQPNTNHKPHHTLAPGVRDLLQLGQDTRDYERLTERHVFGLFLQHNAEVRRRMQQQPAQAPTS